MQIQIKDHIPLIIEIVKKFTSNHKEPITDSEEFAEACLNIARYSYLYDSNRGAVSTFISNIAKNAVLSRNKYYSAQMRDCSKLNRVSLFNVGITFSSDYLDDAPIKWSKLRQYLNPREILIIESIYINNMSLRECGKSMKLSREWVKVLKHRILSHLRQIMIEKGVNRIDFEG